MKSNILLLLLGICFHGVQANLEYLEVLNLKAWKVNTALNSNEKKTLREEARAKPRGFFGRMFGKVFGTLPKNPPQQDLDELAQLFATLNTADISTLFYLKKSCKDSVFDPAKDPNLCEKYPEILVKQVQNRLDVISAKVIHSKGALKFPPNWIRHTISATDLLQDIDTQNQMEYKVKQAVAKVVAPEEAEKKDSDRDNSEDIIGQIGENPVKRQNEEEKLRSQRSQQQEQLERSSAPKPHRDYTVSRNVSNDYYSNDEPHEHKRKPCLSVQLPLQIITQPLQVPVPIQVPAQQVVQAPAQQVVQVPAPQVVQAAPAQAPTQQLTVQTAPNTTTEENSKASLNELKAQLNAISTIANKVEVKQAEAASSASK